MKLLKTVALAAAITGAANVNAQDTSLIFDSQDNAPHFGARLSLDVSSAANGGAYYSNKAGFSLGAVYDIPLFMNAYFEPGLSIFYNTFGTVKFDQVEFTPPAVSPDVVPTPETKIYQVDGTIKNFGFRVPLLFGYHFDVAEDLKVHVFTGPQINLSLISRFNQPEHYDPLQNHHEEISESLFGTGGFKHIDLQWNFGVGVEYEQYYVSLSGALGMTKMKDSSSLLPRDLRRNMFAITLGYNFQF